MSKQHSLKEKWRQHLQSWRDSGLSQSAWCRQHDIRPNQFWYWRKKLDGASQSAPREDRLSTFVPVIPEPQAEATITPGSSLTVSLPNGLTISGFDQTNLKLAQQLIGMLQ